MTEENLEKVNELRKERDVLGKMIDSLSHYNQKSETGSGHQYGCPKTDPCIWWCRLGRLFYPNIKVSKDKITVDPETVYGNVEFNAAAFKSDNIKYEISQIRIRLLGTMIQELNDLKSKVDSNIQEILK